MAKVKKKDALSLEEKLEQALVPIDEHPYEVPENWCWTKIKYGFDVTSSKRIHKSDWLSEGVPFYRTRELVKLSNDGYVDNELFIAEELYDSLTRDFGKPEKDDILISGVGTIGVPYIVDGMRDFYFKDGNVIWFKNKKIFMAKYIYYLYKSLFMKNQIYGKSAGTTVDTYTIVNANETILPLPPLAEQQRIVEQIESLFAKLDEAKEKAESVLDSFDKRKAALYNMAFTGRLTEQWRKINDIDKDKWIFTTIGDVSEVITKGASPRWQGIEYTDDKTQTLFVTSENVREGYLDLSKEKYLDNKINEIQKRSVLHGGDVLVNIVGASIGRAAIYNLEKLANTNQAVCIVRLKDKEINDYVCFYLNSPTAQQYYYDNKVETARANISLANISSMPIMLPPEDERKEIMSKLKYLLEKEDASKEMVNNLIDNLELMKKSILAKAFRGELGTNNPDEESAVELLKSILATE